MCKYCHIFANIPVPRGKLRAKYFAFTCPTECLYFYVFVYFLLKELRRNKILQKHFFLKNKSQAKHKKRSNKVLALFSIVFFFFFSPMFDRELSRQAENIHIDAFFDTFVIFFVSRSRDEYINRSQQFFHPLHAKTRVSERRLQWKDNVAVTVGRGCCRGWMTDPRGEGEGT